MINVNKNEEVPKEERGEKLKGIQTRSTTKKDEDEIKGELTRVRELENERITHE